ncbi:hypothetical protein Q4511_08050 [Paracoccus sp. 1_MG-2023]|uniref:hypothetical protein n=1 Tax=unclassified Paracoccus (in: a-proteobacteria) TaxID=2688777 RepID=UPI001C099ED5|nr:MULTISPECIES: hypothetical protein [unclassified Paracoccus (in: a-proteobacteria)]MBU2957934.1 hypothetical protein [Paracoccus sp. C2R09]MDO6668873.1 hypothetical protein [Paracoccus sp. 1_MG-2023]
MLRRLAPMFTPAAIIALSLLTWRSAAPMGAAMLVVLLPLGYALFAAHARIARQTYRALQDSVWQETSWGPRILTGRIGAASGAAVFAAVTITLLAFEAMTARGSEFWVLPLGAVLASGIYVLARHRCGRHLRDPFDRRMAIALATVIGAAPIIALKAAGFYYITAHPPELLTAGLRDLPGIALARMPEVGMPLQAAFFPLHLLETLKLWIAIDNTQHRWLPAVVSIDAALVGIVGARAAAVLTDGVLAARSSPDRRNRPVRIFRGTMAVLITITVALQLVAAQRAHDLSGKGIAIGTARAARLEEILRTAADDAAGATGQQLELLVDEAFQPVFDRIPEFLNLHYSIRGEYAELAAVAARQLDMDVENMLTAGLPDHVRNAADQADSIFAQQYAKALQVDMEAIWDGVDPGAVIAVVLRDATQRAALTKPVAAGVGLAGGAAVGMLGRTIAKKVGTRIAAKAATKGAMKGGSILAGAGTGAAACAPAGPFALACTAIGGAAAWVAADMAMIQLDEVLNREEFELELREVITEQKAETLAALQSGLRQKNRDLHRVAPQQTRDLILAQLSEDRRMATCTEARQLTGNYAIINDRLAARTSPTLRAFQADLSRAVNDPVLGPMAQEMRRQIDANALVVQVSGMTLTGNFRFDDRADRDVTGLIELGGHSFDPERGVASREGFAFDLMPDLTLHAGRDPGVSVALQQHLRIRSDRFFGATGGISIDDQLKDSSGRAGSLALPLQFRRDPDAADLAGTNAPDGPAAPATLTLQVTAVPLAEPLPPIACGDRVASAS